MPLVKIFDSRTDDRWNKSSFNIIILDIAGPVSLPATRQIVNAEHVTHSIAIKGS